MPLLQRGGFPPHSWNLVIARARSSGWGACWLRKEAVEVAEKSKLRVIRSYLRLVGKHPEARRSLWRGQGTGLCHHLLTCPLDPQGLWCNPSSVVWNRRNKYLLLLYSSFFWMLNPWSLDLHEYDVQEETECIKLREEKEIILVWRAPGWKVRTLPSSI